MKKRKKPSTPLKSGRAKKFKGASRPLKKQKHKKEKQMTETKTNQPTEQKRKRTDAVSTAVERIVERVDDNHWTDEQGMARLTELSQYIANSRSETDDNFFRRVEEFGTRTQAPSIT